MNEDDEPRPQPKLLTPPVLDRLGVEELQGYVTALRNEIARVEGEITRKQGMRAMAESFFKSSAT